MDMKKDLTEVEAVVTDKTVQEVGGTVIAAVAAGVQANGAGKKWYESKTVWANVVLALAVLAQHKFGFVIGPDMQAMAITGVNLVLRKVTKDPITW